MVNQPGNARSSEAAAGALRAVLPWVKRHFHNALVRGDTDFDRADVLQEVIDAHAYFAIGGRVYPNRAALAQALAESVWQPFIPRVRRGRCSAPARQGRTPNWRKHQAAQRGFRKSVRIKLVAGGCDGGFGGTQRFAIGAHGTTTPTMTHNLRQEHPR